MDDVKNLGGMNNQSKSSQWLKLKMPSTLFLALCSWNLGWLQLNNLILSIGKWTLADWSPKTLSPKKKGRRWSPSLIWLAQTSDARLPLELNPMLEGIETFTTFFHQLHCWLEILEMDTPTDMELIFIVQNKSPKTNAFMILLFLCGIGFFLYLLR